MVCRDIKIKTNFCFCFCTMLLLLLLHYDFEYQTIISHNSFISNIESGLQIWMLLLS